MKRAYRQPWTWNQLTHHVGLGAGCRVVCLRIARDKKYLHATYAADEYPIGLCAETVKLGIVSIGAYLLRGTIVNRTKFCQ